MRILVVGAGAIGGYFGGRLLEAGRDVTFLVRPRRAAQLAKTGLVIRSPLGDANLPAPSTVTIETLGTGFDLILLSCKAYDLEGAADSFAPAVQTATAILPLLNGMAHMDYLEARFGTRAVLGGQCQISTDLDTEGHILHLNDFHILGFGEIDGVPSPRVQAIAATMTGARFDSRPSQAIMLEMWEKWLLIAAVAGITCLMRATVGDIVAANAVKLTNDMLDECAAIATAHGYPPRQAFLDRVRGIATAPGSTFAASMLRDIERRAPIEADHIIGDLVHRAAAKSVDCPLLRIAHAHVNAYEIRRKREHAAVQAA